MLSNSFNRSSSNQSQSNNNNNTNKQQQNNTNETLDSSKNKINSNNETTTMMSTHGNGNHLNSSFNQLLSYEFNEEQDQCLQLFDKWSPIEQTEFVENLLRRMCHFQHGHINNFLKPMLQRDFISSLPGKLE